MLPPYALALLATAPAVAAAAQTNYAVSLNDAGQFGATNSEYAQISGNGRYVVFQSRSQNLAPGLSGGFAFIFRHDLETRTTEVVSVDMNGVGADLCFAPSVSETGRFVAFGSARTDLVPGDTNDSVDIFVRDMVAGGTERVSVHSNGVQGDDHSERPRISADGRFVTFDSDVRFDPRDVNFHPDVYRHDRLTGVTEYVSVTQAGDGADSWCVEPEISDSGRYIAFRSRAANFGSNTPNDVNIFWKDMQTGELRHVDRPSVSTTNSNLGSAWPAISGNGQVVTFTSQLWNLVPGDTDFQHDVYAYDVATDTIDKLTLRPDGVPATGSFSSRSGVSFRGRFVAFSGASDDLLSGGTGGYEEVYVRDRLNDTTERVSVSWFNGPISNAAFDPHMDRDGHTITFMSRATNITIGYSGFAIQVYARDLRQDIGTSYCAAVPNSTGALGNLGALGFAAANRNEVTLQASSLPTSVLTFFLASLDQGFVAQPGGSEGNLCLGGSIGRYIRPGEVRNSGAAGATQLKISLTDVPQPNGSIVISAGTSLYFQGWHRDAAAGMTTSNFTTGLRIDLQ